MAGAFGGILGCKRSSRIRLTIVGLSRMVGVGGKSGWSWIFIIEGLLSLVIGVASIWMVHDWPDQARFLTPIEREMVFLRLKQDSGLQNEGTFSWRMVRKALKDWKTYVMMLMYIGCAEPIYSQSWVVTTRGQADHSLFSPTIIAALGTFTTSQSLLLSTPRELLFWD